MKENQKTIFYAEGMARAKSGALVFCTHSVGADQEGPGGQG